jgi:hypothetical protein
MSGLYQWKPSGKPPKPLFRDELRKKDGKQEGRGSDGKADRIHRLEESLRRMVSYSECLAVRVPIHDQHNIDRTPLQEAVLLLEEESK